MRINFRNTKNFVLAGATAFSMGCSKELPKGCNLLAEGSGVKLYELSSQCAVSILEKDFETMPIDTFQIKSIHLLANSNKDLSSGLSKKDTFAMKLWYKAQTIANGKNSLTHKRFVEFDPMLGYKNIDTLETVKPEYSEILVTKFIGKNKGKVTIERSYELPGQKTPVKAESPKMIEM